MSAPTPEPEPPDRLVLVTGATGIGEAVARRVADEGAAVFVVSLVEEDVTSLVSGLQHEGHAAAGVAADLTDERAAESAFEVCRDALGAPDGVVAVAGGSGRRQGDGPIADIPLQGWDATIEMNLTPTFLTVREAVRAMPGGGSIVVVSSVLASHPSPLFVTHGYTAAKSAISGLVRAVASRYASSGIRLNAVAPGLVRTPMAARAAADPETAAYATRKQPLAGGLLPPESVAAAVSFLLGDDARHITGQVLEVDGGWGVTEVRE